MANLTAIQPFVMTLIILASFLLLSAFFIFLIRKNNHAHRKDKYLLIDDVAHLNEVLRLIDYRIKSSKGQIYFTLLLVSIDDYDRLAEIINPEGVREYRSRVKEALRKALPIGGKMAETTEKETFLIYLPELYNEEGLQEKAQMFKNSMERRFLVCNSVPLQKTASVAVTTYPAQGSNVIDLINNLLTAIYSAKKTGGNELIYYTSDLEKESRYIERYKDIKQAIDQNKIPIRFNPIMHMEKETICGGQSIISRISDDGSLVEYERLMSYLEESDDDFWFTIWAMEKSILSNIDIIRSEMGRDFFITLKVGYKFLCNQNSAYKLQNFLDRYNISAKNVILEVDNILENESGNRFVKNLLQMQSTGIRIMASITKANKDLTKLIEVYDVDILKIWIGDVINNNEWILSLLKHAHNSRKKVIVHGIENEEQANKLKTKSIAYVQGPYYGSSLMKEQLVKMMQI